MVYMQALAYGREFFEKEDNQLKTQMNWVMEALMMMSAILHLLLQHILSYPRLVGIDFNHGMLHNLEFLEHVIRI